MSAALDVDATDRPAGFHRTGEYLEATSTDAVAQIGQLKAETHIGLVRTEAVHRLGVGHPDEIVIQLLSHIFTEQVLQKALVHFHHVVCRHERHFGVDLGELRLTVGTQVLVPVATGDLEITVKARNHQKLLVQLGRLGQGVEFSLVNTGGYQVVSCSLRRRLDEIRGLDVQKSVCRIICPGIAGDSGACHDVSLHIGAAQIQITVFQPKLGVYVAVLHNFKGRGLRSGKNGQRRYGDFNLTGGKIAVDSALASSAHGSSGAENELRTHRKGTGEYVLVAGVVKGKLNKPRAVPQVNEDQRAEVTLLLRPTHYAYFFSDLLCGQLAAVMCPFFSQLFSHRYSFGSFLFIRYYV